MENYLDKNWNDYIKDLEGLIKIPSFLVKNDDYPNIHHKKALKYMQNLAEINEMKFYTDSKGYYGYIEIGHGNEMIGILAHLDVVDSGEIALWNTDPFELTEDNGKLIGRGVNDDKGPLMLSFYLLKEMLEKNISLNKRVRLIYGTDEESLWRGITKYIEDGQEQPTMGWTPDCDFPVIYGEKGTYRYWLSFRENINFEFKGYAENIPISLKTTYKGEKVAQVKAKMEELHYEYKINSDGSLDAIGFSPNIDSDITKEINANTRLAEAVSMVEKSEFLSFITKYIGTETNGDTLLAKHYEDETGSINNNLAIIKTAPGYIFVEMFLVFPFFAIEWQEIEKKIIETCNKEKVIYERAEVRKKWCINKNNSFVQTLLKVYKEVTKEQEAKPIILNGGGTYARSMKNIVGFGPLFPHSINTWHKANEYMEKSDLLKAYLIYNKAINELLKED